MPLYPSVLSQPRVGVSGPTPATPAFVGIAPNPSPSNPPGAPHTMPFDEPARGRDPGPFSNAHGGPAPIPGGGIGLPPREEPVQPVGISINTGPGSVYARMGPQGGYGKPSAKSVDAPNPEVIHQRAYSRPGAGNTYHASELAKAGPQPATPALRLGVMGFPGSATPMQEFDAPQVPQPNSAHVGDKTEPRTDSPVKFPTPSPTPTATPGTAPSIGIPGGPPRMPAPAPRSYGEALESGVMRNAHGIAIPSSLMNPASGPVPASWKPGNGMDSYREPLGADSYRDTLVDRMNNPGFNRSGGIAVYSAPDPGEAATYDEHGQMQSPGRPMTTVQDRNALTSVTAQNQLAAYDQGRANIRQGDAQAYNQNPHTTVQADVAAMGTPQGRALIEAKFKLPPGSLPAPGDENRLDATNVGPQDDVPRAVQGLHNAMNSDIPLHSKVNFARAAVEANPNGPHQRYFDAWFARQRATNQRFDHELNGYLNTVNGRDVRFHNDMKHLGYAVGPVQ